MSEQSLGRLIAQGRTAEIYAWTDGYVLKLFRDWCPPSWLDYEFRIARIVQDAKLPVPAVSEIVEVKGRRGLVYERVDGPSMLRVIQTHPWQVRRLGRLMADLHAAIHNLSVPDLPSYKVRLTRDITAAAALPDDLKTAALARLSSLPDGTALCHGDFHLDNIIMARGGPVIIDWMTAASGNPLADMARTRMIIYTGTPPNWGALQLWLLGRLRAQLQSAYLGRYAQLRPFDRQEFAAWQPVMAAARLNEKIAGEREWLLAEVRRGWVNRTA